MWIGKILGSVVGFASGGPLGAVVGALLGNTFDSGLARLSGNAEGALDERGAIFYQTTFILLGRLAKADGQVSSQEIDMAELIMQRLEFTDEQRQQAISYFNQGKTSIGLPGQLKSFARFYRDKPEVMTMFFEFQLLMAYADGPARPSQLQILQQLCRQLRISQADFEALRMQVKNSRMAGHVSQQMSLSRAYRLLGVEQGADQAAVKRAYRKLMSQHHPDKLQARGENASRMQEAKQKVQQIQEAYDRVRKQG